MPRFIVLGSSNAVPKVDQENSHLYFEGGKTRIFSRLRRQCTGKFTEKRY